MRERNNDPDSGSRDGLEGVGLPERDATALREDLVKEYLAVVDVVGGFDARVMTVKGWSVTLSLAGLGLGFQQGHYALFALAAATALAFWFIEGQMKTQQWRYYSRMRDIELAQYHLNRVELPELGEVSALRIDQQWAYTGEIPDWRNDPPWRRTPEENGGATAASAPAIAHALILLRCYQHGPLCRNFGVPPDL